ncbi:MAG TPA: pilus assembly protein PilP [Gammaproteobacteria bacterium]
MFATRTQHKTGLPLKSILGSALLIIALVGCANDNVSDLQAHVAQVKAKKPPPIPPLPEIKPYETYVYDETTLRDPFQAAARKTVVRDEDEALRPNMKRQREVLEQFPLDTLAMVGSLEQGGERWALIRAKDGTLYRTKKGRFIGQDYGEIIRVTETEIVLQETVPDGLGRWVKRQATLGVSE